MEVTAATDLAFLDPFRDMATAVYAKRRRRPPDRDAFLRLLWSKLAPLDSARVFLAHVDGELVAAAVIARHGTTGHYLDGVSRPEFNRLGANSLLQWRAIRWLISNGIERYDMVGAGIPEIARFMRSFGSEIELRVEAMKATSLPARAGLAGYRAFAPLLRKAFFQAGKLLDGFVPPIWNNEPSSGRSPSKAIQGQLGRERRRLRALSGTGSDEFQLHRLETPSSEPCPPVCRRYRL